MFQFLALLHIQTTLANKKMAKMTILKSICHVSAEKIAGLNQRPLDCIFLICSKQMLIFLMLEGMCIFIPAHCTSYL